MQVVDRVAAPPAQAMAARLLEMINASWMSQALCVAAELGLADLLAPGSRTADDLARAAGCEQRSMHRLMRALASIGVCTEQEDGAFALAPMGTLLRADARPSVRSWAIWWGKYQWPEWGHLRHSVRTGESARVLLSGHESYDFVMADPGAADVFNRAMSELTHLAATEVARVCDFSAAKRVVDIGGGRGELLATILSAYPALRGTLFDLPHAIAAAAALIRTPGFAQRCVLVAGDFFESVPGGGDVYILKSVLHNWDNRRSAIILDNCRRAMPGDARLVLVERIMPARMTGAATDRAVARSDLSMLVGIGGRERTETEFIALLAASGFRVAGVFPAGLEFSLVEAIPC